jgi:hypothetical protein
MDSPLGIKAALTAERIPGMIYDPGLLTPKELKFAKLIEHVRRTDLIEFCRIHSLHRKWVLTITYISKMRKQELIDTLVSYVLTTSVDPDLKNLLAQYADSK